MKSLSAVDKIIVFIAAFSAVRMIVGAIAALYLLANGFSLAEIAALKTLQTLVFVVLEVPLAYFADRAGRRAALLYSVLFCAGWLLLTGLALSKSSLYIAEIFNAVSLALASGTSAAYLIDAARREEAQTPIHALLGRCHKIQFVAMGGAAFIGAAFVAADSQIPWLVAAALALVLFAAAAHALPADANGRQSGRSFAADLRTAHKELRRPATGYAALAMICIAAFYQVFIHYWQPFAADGFARWHESGFVYGALFLFILGGQALAGWLAETRAFSRLISLSAIAALFAFMLGLLAALYAPSLLPAAAVIFFAAQRLIAIVALGAFNHNIPASLRATMSAFVSTVLRLILLVVLPLVGFLLDRAGWIVAVVFYGVCAALALGLLRCMSDKNEQSDKPPNRR